MIRATQALVLTGALSLSACAPGTTFGNAETAGLLAGAGTGFITARILNSSPQWTIIATLAGAAAGTLVAQNQARNECAYSRGDGTYVVKAC